MIQFKSWRQYTHVVDGVRFPPNIKEPFILVYFSENSNFINDYPKLNLRKLDAKVVVVPITKIPRTRLTSEFRKMYRDLGLIPYSINQKVPDGKNIILDLSQYTNAIDLTYKPTTYRQRAGFFISNMLDKAVNTYPGNYQKVLFYSVDVTKNINNFINRKVFPILKEMKNDNFKFDHMLLNYISQGDSRYRLLVKDGEYKFQRVMHYIKQ